MLDKYLDECIAPWIERQGKDGIYSKAYAKVLDGLVDPGEFKALYAGVMKLYPDDQDLSFRLRDESTPVRERAATMVNLMQLERNEDKASRKQIANAYLAYYFGRATGDECPVPDEARKIVEQDHA